MHRESAGPTGTTCTPEKGRTLAPTSPALPDGDFDLRDGKFGDELLEIAEVIYHASGYAGFPAANTACKIAREVLDADS